MLFMTFSYNNNNNNNCSPGVHTSVEQCAAADEQYFEKICSKNNHILHRLLRRPAAASQSYNLRSRVHNLQLPQHSSSSIACPYWSVAVLTNVLQSDRFCARRHAVCRPMLANYFRGLYTTSSNFCIGNMITVMHSEYAPLTPLVKRVDSSS